MDYPLGLVSVRGYKSIRELVNFRLQPLNILIGANGAGKSNFISLFELLNQIVHKNLQNCISKAGGANSLVHYGQREYGEIDLNFGFGPNIYQCTLVPTQGDTLIFSEEIVSFHEHLHRPGQSPVLLGGGHKETRLYEEARTQPASATAGEILEEIDGWRVYHFHDTSKYARIRQPGNIRDNQILRPDASNLAAYLYALREKKPEYYLRIVSIIRMVAPFFTDFCLRPLIVDPERIQLEWREKESDTRLNVQLFSDGMLRFICLVTLLVQPNIPSLIIIDEPELGLHPYAIEVLACLLKNVSQRTRVIVSTQSVQFVNHFLPQDIIIVDRKGGHSSFTRPSSEDLADWLVDFRLGDLWQRHVLGDLPGKCAEFSLT